MNCGNIGNVLSGSDAPQASELEVVEIVEEELVHDDEMRLQYGEEYLECDPDSDKDEVDDLIPNLEDFAHDEIEDPEDTNELMVVVTLMRMIMNKGFHFQL